MSLDPKSLKRSDKVTFGGKVVRTVGEIYHGCDNGNAIMSIWFTDGDGLRTSDPLWEIAELVKPELPGEFSFGYLGVDNNYHADGYSYTPEKLLKLLKQDVAALESAGVKEDSRCS